MSHVIVTGGAGRLGRSIVSDLLGAGHEVTSMDRTRSDAAELLHAHQHAIDLTDADATRRAISDARADTVIHLAAIAVPFSAPEDVILRTNAQLAMSVLGGAVSAGVRRVIAASSPTVLGYGAPAGWAPARFPLDESTPLAPANAYALSKMVTEQMVGMLRRQTGDSTRFAAFRPCYVVAPEEWSGAPTSLGHTMRERVDDPALAAPSLFNYLDARDAGAFVTRLVDAVDQIPNGETFFVGAADALARRPLAELIPRFHPGTAQAAVALTGTTPAFSTAKAERLLGWSARYSWRDQLADLAPGSTVLADAHAP